MAMVSGSRASRLPLNRALDFSPQIIVLDLSSICSSGLEIAKTIRDIATVQSRPPATVIAVTKSTADRAFIGVPIDHFVAE